MTRLLRGEGWVELLFALIAISVFGVWMFTVNGSRLNSLTLWEAWQSQQPTTPVERVAPATPAPAVDASEGALAAR